MIKKFTPHNRNNDKGYKARIIPDRPTSRERNEFLSLGMFYLNPASWDESKSTKWVKHEIPGLSDPHQQWISGGARQITFEALVTNDKAEGAINYNVKNSIVSSFKSKSKSVIKRIGGIASQVANIPELSISESIQSSNQNPAQALELDITEKLNYYRSLVYPESASKENGVEAPPIPVRLIVGSTFGNRTKGAKFVVDKISIKITKQYSDLTPIEARVTFTLTELTDEILSAERIQRDQ